MEHEQGRRHHGQGRGERPLEGQVAVIAQGPGPVSAAGEGEEVGQLVHHESAQPSQRGQGRVPPQHSHGTRV